MLKFLLSIIPFILFSCGYKSVNLEEGNLSVCLNKVIINTPEPILLDVLNKNITDVLISRGHRLDCSTNKQMDMYINVKSLRFVPIGYSTSQRASIYKISMTINIKLENKEGKIVLDKDIIETTQYVGAGLRADI